MCHIPPKTNIEPQNHPFEKENHLPNLHFGVPGWFSGVHSNFKFQPCLFTGGYVVIRDYWLLVSLGNMLRDSPRYKCWVEKDWCELSGSHCPQALQTKDN